LRGVGGVGVVSGQATAEGVDPVVVPAEQGIEGLVVALQGGDDQRLVGDRRNDGATVVGSADQPGESPTSFT
jgi:hypothetical protein